MRNSSIIQHVGQARVGSQRPEATYVLAGGETDDWIMPYIENSVYALWNYPAGVRIIPIGRMKIV